MNDKVYEQWFICKVCVLIKRQVLPGHNDDIIVVLLQNAPEALNYKQIGCTGIFFATQDISRTDYITHKNAYIMYCGWKYMCDPLSR